MNGLSRKIYLKLPLPTEDDPRSDQQRILDSLAVAGVEERVHITVHILRKLYPLLDNAKWKITVSLAWNGENWEMVEIEEGDTTAQHYGLAVDLGSTTVVARLLDCNSGEILKEVSCFNKQIQWGTDILSRIFYCKDNREKLEEVRRATVESICEITEEQIAEYFKLLQEEEIKAETVNRQICDIHRFFVYLNAKGHIKGIIFDPNYYIQKVFPYHHDRSVQEDEYMEILKRLKFFPEVQRLIFLNLWATGLRISEVCTLKGGAYYWDGEDAWIKVYQIKMKAEKMIPISLVLYQIMKIYIKKHHIKPTDFLFKSKDGGAYRTGTFVKGFKANCKKYGIHISGETFKTHDYRHTLASSFYDEGVSIQTIRDYLGHNNENMTKQYIDYMPKRIEQANKEYFNQAENLLATGIIPKKRGEKTGK